MIRVGAGAAFWGHQPAPDGGFEVGLARARTAGFTGIEVVPEWLSDPRPLQSQLLQSDLRLVGGRWSTRLLERSVGAELEVLTPYLNILIGLGAHVLAVTEVALGVDQDPGCPPDRRPRLFPLMRSRLVERLEQLAEWLKERGIQMAYLPRMGTVIQSEGEVSDLLGRTGDALGWVLDTGHLTYAGASALNLVDAFGTRVRHVIMKDVRPGVLEVAGLKKASFKEALADGVFTEPGMGMVDFAPLVSAVLEAGYVDWFVVDTESGPASPAAAETAYRMVQGLIEAT